MNATRKRNTRYRGAELPLPEARRAATAAPPPPPSAAAVDVAPPPPAHAPDSQLYTLEQAAARLALSAKTTRRMVTAGRIHGVQLGAQWRVSEAELRRVALEGVKP